MKKLRKFKIIYESNWNSATPEQKKELQERLDRACDMVFRKVIEREIATKVGANKK